MVFLLLLAIAFGTAAALLLLVVGVLEAPWPVLLGILVLGLLATQRISTESRALRQDMNAFSDHAKQSKTKPSKTKPSSGREANSKTEQATSEFNHGNSAPASSAVTYRGVTDRGDHSPVITDGAIAQGLRYRGIAYGECKAVTATPDATSDSPPSQSSGSSQAIPDIDAGIPLETPPSPTESASTLSTQNASSPEITPAPPQVTVVEGTYRGRHWERVVSLPDNAPPAPSDATRPNSNGTAKNG